MKEEGGDETRQRAVRRGNKEMKGERREVRKRVETRGNE